MLQSIRILGIVCQTVALSNALAQGVKRHRATSQQLNNLFDSLIRFYGALALLALTSLSAAVGALCNRSIWVQDVATTVPFLHMSVDPMVGVSF